jgi:hypothetical protein
VKLKPKPIVKKKDQLRASRDSDIQTEQHHSLVESAGGGAAIQCKCGGGGRNTNTVETGMAGGGVARYKRTWLIRCRGGGKKVNSEGRQAGRSSNRCAGTNHQTSTAEPARKYTAAAAGAMLRGEGGEGRGRTISSRATPRCACSGSRERRKSTRQCRLNNACNIRTNQTAIIYEEDRDIWERGTGNGKCHHTKPE